MRSREATSVKTVGSGVLPGSAPSIGATPDVVIDLRDPDNPRRVEASQAAEARPSLARRRALVLLVALNVLNLADAVLTFVLVRSGAAREGNPVVDALTLPGKVVFVTALSLLLWRLRPGALVIPVAGYALVVCYTLAGALLL